MARKNDYILEIDQFVGGKIYSLRLAKGLSRQQLWKCNTNSVMQRLERHPSIYVASHYYV